LHDRACSTVNWQLHPSHLSGISIGWRLYLSRTLSLHSSADILVPFNRLGTTVSLLTYEYDRWSFLDQIRKLSKIFWSDYLNRSEFLCC
jgi:hypothetical protein